MPPSDEEAVLVDAVSPAAVQAVDTVVEAVALQTAAPLVEKAVVASAHKSSALFAQYENWVTAHTGIARNLETMLYIAPQLVPKKAVEPEIATQAGYSLVGLLHLYHDYILYKSAKNPDDKPPSAVEQLTRMVRVPLSLITHTQVLSEVLARKIGGEVGKWRVIVWIEVVKSVLRLILLMQTRKSLLIKGGKYKGVETSPQPSAFARFKKNSAEKRGSRTGKTFAAKKTEEPVAEEAAGSPQAPNTVTFEDPAAVIHGVPREELLLGGEVLHILRPVAYALLRIRRTEESWTPVLVSFLMEISGLWMSNAALKPTDKEAKSAEKPSQKVKDELAARKMALLLYFLRDPVFASVTQPATGKACDVLDYVPVVGRVVRFASTSVMNYYHQFHFYTSAS
ncbi:hypothetical protein Gpo141_00006676 [Globisporangium polare]